jgi:hypothetical protein
MAHPHGRSGARQAVLLALACGAALACTEVKLEEPTPYDYTTGPVAIVNPDWGVIPLPNNFLNPVKQADIVAMPGVPVPPGAPTRMAIPIVDAAAAKTAQDLGYVSVTEDSDLSKALLTGQNRLDGFIASFAPAIPFSRPIDMDTLVPFDGTNAATANFWFVDVTDPAHPEALAPADYLRVFNWQMAEQMPYKLSLRFPAPGILSPPEDFATGHTYLVVATGWTDKGIHEALSDADKAAGKVAQPVTADSPFLLFAAPTEYADIGTTYIGADGLARSGVVSGLAAAQSLEGGRQLTNWGLQIWEALPGVKDAWKREDVVTAYHFTVATNPMPDYFDATAAFLGGNAVKATPADALDKATGTMTTADAGCDSTLDFAIDKPVKADTVTNATVKLFRIEGTTYTEVPLDVTVADAATAPKVTAKPKAALKGGVLHVAVVTNGILNAAGTRTAVDQTYFGVARAGLLAPNADGTATFKDTPLVTFDEKGSPVAWNSPYLDSRLDTLILSGVAEDVTKSSLKAAEQTLLGILAYLEGLRKNLKPHLDYMVLGPDGKPGTGDVVAEREDIVLAWTFTTAACGQ